MTLAHAGARVVALVTEYERQQSYAAFRVGAALRWRVPVWTSTAVRRVDGPGAAGRGGGRGRPHRRGAVRAVRHRWSSPADWIPDHELARRAGLAMDPGTRGPVVDTRLRTSARGRVRRGQPGARGRDRGHRRAVRPARRPADRRGARCRRIGRCRTGWRGGRARGRARGAVPVRVEPPLRWISPNAIASRWASLAPPPLGRFVLRSQEFRRLARLEVRQDGRLLARSRVTRLMPERPVHLRAAWLARVDPAGGPVRIIYRGAAALRFIWVGSVRGRRR